MTTDIKAPRIEVVDALRGFAILAIMLVHNIEHFDYAYFPEYLPEWMKAMDSFLWDSIFFLFGGKAYSIFAILFGLTFFIQFTNQAKKGKDFRGRFLWRLLLLFGFSIVNSAFYQGDILMLYAILGVVLVMVCNLSNRWILILAAFCMLQPFELGRFFYSLFNPDYVKPEALSGIYFAQTGTHITGDSFFELLKGNLIIGRKAVMLWYWENGRVFQTVSLFMIGFLLGRKKLLVPSEASTTFWKKTLLYSLICFVPLLLLSKHTGLFLSENSAPIFAKVVTTWSNFAFTLILISLFVMLYQQKFFKSTLEKLVPFGKMSLSNYMIMSVIGACIYYGFGLGVYEMTGASCSLLIGIVMFIAMRGFASWYMARHKHGPLEYIWHKATWI